MNQRRHRSLVLAGASIAALALAGCSTAAPSPETDGEPFAISVAVHTANPFADYSGIYLAQELGFYEDAGLDVTIDYVGSSSLSIQQVGAGGAQIGLAGSDTILAAATEEVPITVVANHIQVTPTGVLVDASHNARELADIAGLSVASALTSPEPVMLAGLLAEAGLDRDSDLTMVWVEQNTKCTLLFEGSSDACTGWATSHVLQAERAGRDVDFIGFSTEDDPILGHSMFANNDFIESSPEQLRAFLAATYLGYAAAEDDLDAVVDHILAVNSEEDPEYMLKSLDITHTQLMHSARTAENGWGWMEDAPWQRLHDLLLAGEMIPGAVEISELYTNEFLPEDAAW